VRYGLIITTGDPRTVATLAAEAEAAGHDDAGGQLDLTPGHPRPEVQRR